jgi:hypothetical protein
MAMVRSIGNGVSSTHWRISAPVLVGVRRRGEAARHANAGVGQLADHFAERRVLAADLFDVGHAQFFEGDDKRFHQESFQGVEFKKSGC